MGYFFPDTYDDSSTISIYVWNGWMGDVKQTTLGNIASIAASKGFDSFLIRPMTGNVNGYIMIYPFNVGSVQNLHIGYGSYLNYQGSNPYAQVGSDVISSEGNTYILNFDLNDWSQQGYEGLGTMSVDGISYRFAQAASAVNNMDVILYIGGSYQTLYVNGVIPIVYVWKAWTILQGNSEQYRQRLTALKDDSIGDISTLNYGVQNDFIFIAPNVDMVPYARNMNYNSPVKIAWSGINWMTMELVPLQDALTNQVRALFKLYAATSSDTVPIYSETRDFFVGSTNHFYLSFVHDDTNQAAAFLPVYYAVGSTETPFSWGNSTPSAADMLLIWQWLQASGSPDPDPQPERPYDNGTTDNGGGGGNPTPQDDIHTPNVPALGATASGMFTVYCPTDGQLQQIAAFLWSDNFIENVKKYFNNVSDNIIAFYVLPLEPGGLQTKNFKIGNLENASITGVKYLSSRFVSVDMGSVSITRRWGTYLDFAPFTKFSLYLPGVGIVALDTDDIMAPPNKDGYLSDEVGSTISLSYTIDLFTGVLVAYVYVDGQIRYQFPGRMGYSLPLTGQNYTAMGTGFVQAMAGLATTIATGGTAAPFTAGVTAAGIVNAMKPDVYRGGNLSGDASMLSLKTPMLIKTVPNVPAHEGLEDFVGGPSYKIDTINNFSGFTQAIEAHVEGISCTSAERDEIMQLLKSGVII